MSVIRVSASRCMNYNASVIRTSECESMSELECECVSKNASERNVSEWNASERVECGRVSVSQ